MGIAVAKVIEMQKLNASNLSFLALLIELDTVFMMMISWVILLTPFAVLSLIAQTIGATDDIVAVVVNLIQLIACILTCYVVHFLLTYCCGYYFLTKGRNPFSFIKHLAPAQIMAFSVSSSVACIPLSIESVMATGLVPDSVTRFVIPLGSTVNMDGGAIQIICANIWLARYNGMPITIVSFLMLLILATFGSMGAAPVPNSGLALILTTYNTVFGGGLGTPEGFSLLFAIDWFVDRCATILNVTGDCTVCGVLGAMVEVKHKESLFVRKSIANYHQNHRDMMVMMGTEVKGAMKDNDDEILSNIEC